MYAGYYEDSSPGRSGDDMESSILTHFDRRISMPPLFVDITGSHTAAIMLAQLLYWHLRPKRPDRWTFKDQEDWFKETRLTWRQVHRIKDLLEQLGFIEVKRTPYKIGFRLVEKKLEAAILKAQGAKKIATEPRPKQEKRINKRLILQKVDSTKGRFNKRLIGNQQKVDSLPKRYIGTRARKFHRYSIKAKNPPNPPTPAAQGRTAKNSPRQQRWTAAMKNEHVQLVMRGASWTSQSLAPVILDALEQHRRKKNQDIGESAKTMLENWQVFADDARFMRHTVTPRKWITEGLWLSSKLWPYDRAEVERYRNARVGSRY